MGEKIWLARPKFFGLEKIYIEEAIASNWISTVGGQLDTFKTEIKEFLDFSGGVSLLNSGTSALHMALLSADIKKGDFVLCSTLTFIASANAIRYVGASPIFIDSEKETWNLSPELLSQALEDLKKKGKLPKALILVHMCGIPAKVEEILTICRLYGVLLIEDAAGAFGSKHKGKYLGTFGDYGIFSLNGNKIITGGSGGILLSKNSKSAERVDFLCSQAKSKVNPYEHKELGYNYGMDNLSVAVARAQLKFITQILEQKKDIADFYKKSLKGVEFAKVSENDFQNNWLTPVLLSSKEHKMSVFTKLQKENIESRFVWKPMHLQELYMDFETYLNGVSNTLFERGLCLPSDINMSVDDLKKVTTLINQYA